MRTAPKHHRRSWESHGFTLIELLIVITIIALLSAALMSALFSAGEAAKRARTEQLVTRIGNQVVAQYESYQTKRLPFSLPSASATSRAPYAQQKLWGLRELMQMEMPDRYSDITMSPAVYPSSYPPDLQRIYKNRITRSVGGSNLTASIATAAASCQSAECLYMVVTEGCADRDAVGISFSQSDIGDTDNDRMPEFLDGWGNPIAWIRWPAGMVSDLQPMYQSSGSYTRDPIRNHDAFDPLQADYCNITPTSAPQSLNERAYNLIPLIVSAGGNGSYGLAGLEDPTASSYAGIMDSGTDTPTSSNYSTAVGNVSGTSDPYMRYQPSGRLLGDAVDPTAFDNIMNHNITSGFLVWTQGE